MLYLLFLLALLPKEDCILKEKVDLVEYNHYHDANMKHVFDQIIFYDWSDQKKAFMIRDWRLVKTESQIPKREKDYFIVRWHDDGILREVKASYRRETWTQYDPELIGRNDLPQDQRILLKQLQQSTGSSIE